MSRRILNKLMFPFRRRRLERELREEIDFHRDMLKADKVAAGLDATQAALEARRRLGNTTIAREEARAAWIPAFLDSFVADLGYAARGLLKHPAYSVPSLVALVVAIGLNTSVFTVANAVLFRSWPVPDSHEMFVVSLVAKPGTSDEGIPGRNLSFAALEFARERATRSSLAGFHGISLSARGRPGDDIQRLPGLTVSQNFFEVLQVPFLVGGGLAGRTVERDGSVAVISAALWRRWLASDPNVIGRVVYLNDQPTRIVGVLAPEFAGIPPNRTDVYLPLPDPTEWDRAWKGWWGEAADTNTARLTLNVAGRTRPGWSRGNAETELSALHVQAQGGTSSAGRDLRLFGTALGQLPGGLPNTTAVVFALLMVSCLLVLIVACANVGNLQLARSLARGREIATRLALGASAGRLVRQLLTEGFLLALVAAFGAVGVASLVPRVALLQLDPELVLQSALVFTPDWRVMVFSFLLCLVSVLAFALAPALVASRRVALSAACISNRAATPASARVRGALLAVQVAMSAVLLVATALLSRGLVHAVSVDHLGLDPDVVAVTITEPKGHGSYGRDRARILTLSLESALRRDAVTEMSYSSRVPLEPGFQRSPVHLRGSTPGSREEVPIQFVAPTFFSVLQIPLLEGRIFDADPALQEVVVNEAFVRAFPTGSPLGAEIVAEGSVHRIVGVVRDARLTSLEAIWPTIFQPLGREAVPVILMRRPKPEAVAQVAAAIRAIDSELTISPLPLSATLTFWTRTSVMGTQIAATISLLALGLAAVGIFGVFGYLVEERRREIGIRIALGARSTQIVRTIVRSTRGALIGGLSCGLMFAVGSGYVIRSFLFGLSPLDPFAYLVAIAMLASTAVIATFVPARRAARVDPAVTLRAE